MPWLQVGKGRAGALALPSCLASLLALVFGLGLLMADAPIARGGAPAAEDTLSVTALVGVSSRLGSEVIPFSGTVTIGRGEPRMDGGVQVVDLEILSMDLVGTSLTGNVTVAQNPTTASVGEFRSLQPPPDKFPASSFFDVFFEVTAPASPSPTITLRNVDAVHLVPQESGSEVPLAAWPPFGVTYAATPKPCIALVPTEPAEVCVTSVFVTFVGDGPPGPTFTPTPSSSPTPTPTRLAPGPTTTPTAAGGPLPTAVSTPSVVTRLPDTGTGARHRPDRVAWPVLLIGVAGALSSAALLRAAHRPKRA